MSEQTTSSLGRQPVEVVNIIASHLSTADICALRLTCKAVNHRLTEFFLRRFFRTKQFWIDETSLQALIDMSAHPTISRELKHVALGSDHYNNCTDALYGSDSPAMTAAHIQQLRLGVASYQHLQRTGAAIAMLTKAFVNLPNLETLSIRDFDKSERFTAPGETLYGFWNDVEAFNSYGTKAASRATGHHITTEKVQQCLQDTDYDFHKMGDLFTKSLVALANAGSRPSAIEVIITTGDWGLRDRAFYVPTYLQPTLKPVLSKLTKLHIDVELSMMLPCCSQSRLHERDPGMANSSRLLQDFLCLTPQLTWLRVGVQASHAVTTKQFLRWLGGGYARYGGAYSDIYPQPPEFAHLEHFEIAGARVSFEVLTQLILKLSKTLRKLNFRDVTFIMTAYERDDEVNIWSRFLEFLAHNTDLRSLGLSQSRVYVIAPLMQGTVLYKTKKQVRSFDNMKLSLEDLAQKVQVKWDPKPRRSDSDYDNSDGEYVSDDEQEMEVDDGEDRLEADDGEDDVYVYV